MRKGSPDINRRSTQIYANKDSEISPQRRRGRREWLFCLSGDDDKQKHVSIADNNRIIILKAVLNRRFTQTMARAKPQRMPSSEKMY